MNILHFHEEGFVTVKNYIRFLNKLIEVFLKELKRPIFIKGTYVRGL
jgi:hypothetical protein